MAVTGSRRRLACRSGRHEPYFSTILLLHLLHLLHLLLLLLLPLLLLLLLRLRFRLLFHIQHVLPLPPPTSRLRPPRSSSFLRPAPPHPPLHHPLGPRTSHHQPAARPCFAERCWSAASRLPRLKLGPGTLDTRGLSEPIRQDITTVSLAESDLNSQNDLQLRQRTTATPHSSMQRHAMVRDLHPSVPQEL